MAQDAAAGRSRVTVWRKAKRALVLAVAGFLTLSITLVVVYRFLPVPITPLMVIRLVEGEGLHKDWVAYDGISPQVFQAVIAAEDTRFCQHRGFDLRAIEDAFRKNRKGRRLVGASTITMQTAKNLFLWPGRDYLRKGLEAYFTVLLELFWDKHRILEVYVNAPLETVISRDVKGLYKKAQAGEIPHFTGISDPYEPPESPAVEVRTDQQSRAECERVILEALQRAKLL